MAFHREVSLLAVVVFTLALGVAGNPERFIIVPRNTTPPSTTVTNYIPYVELVRTSTITTTNYSSTVWVLEPCTQIRSVRPPIIPVSTPMFSASTGQSRPWATRNTVTHTAYGMIAYSTIFSLVTVRAPSATTRRGECSAILNQYWNYTTTIVTTITTTDYSYASATTSVICPGRGGFPMGVRVDTRSAPTKNWSSTTTRGEPYLSPCPPVPTDRIRDTGTQFTTDKPPTVIGTETRYASTTSLVWDWTTHPNVTTVTSTECSTIYEGGTTTKTSTRTLYSGETTLTTLVSCRTPGTPELPSKWAARTGWKPRRREGEGEAMTHHRSSSSGGSSTATGYGRLTKWVEDVVSVPTQLSVVRVECSETLPIQHPMPLPTP
jgi:hypothetical protein